MMTDASSVSVRRLLSRSAAALSVVAVVGIGAWGVHHVQQHSAIVALAKQQSDAAPNLTMPQAAELLGYLAHRLKGSASSPDADITRLLKRYPIHVQLWQGQQLQQEATLSDDSNWPAPWVIAPDSTLSATLLYDASVANALTEQDRPALQALTKSARQMLMLSCHQEQMTLPPLAMMAQDTLFWPTLKETLRAKGCVIGSDAIAQQAQWLTWQTEHWVWQSNRARRWQQGDVLRGTPSLKDRRAMQRALRRWLAQHRNADGSWPERYDALRDQATNTISHSGSYAEMIVNDAPWPPPSPPPPDVYAEQLIACQLTDPATGTAQGSFGALDCPDASYSALVTARNIQTLAAMLARGTMDEALATRCRHSIALGLRHLLQSMVDSRNYFYLPNPTAAYGGVKLLPNWPMISTEAVVETWRALEAVVSLPLNADGSLEQSRGKQHPEG